MEVKDYQPKMLAALAQKPSASGNQLPDRPARKQESFAEIRLSDTQLPEIRRPSLSKKLWRRAIQWNHPAPFRPSFASSSIGVRKKMNPTTHQVSIAPDL
jgi:hypothetical protein